MAHDTFSKLKRIQEQAHAFLMEKDIGREDDARRHWFHRLAHFWLLVGKSFNRNRCPVRASALAYTTLLALIPLLAVGASITTSLLKKEGGAQVNQLINQLVVSVGMEPKENDVEGQKRKQELIAKIQDFIGNIQSGTLGVTSTIALVFVAIGLLRTIEAAFNDIWGVRSCRGWVASIIQYWAAISLGPIILALVLGLTTGSHFSNTAKWVKHFPFFGTVVFGLLPFVVLSLAFGLLYQLMPNTRVHWKAALIGGVVGGTLWQLNNKLSVTYASKAITYSAIYGSLSVIPLFLVGMYFSWLILLFGAQVWYAFQNREAYLQEKQAETVNQRGREFIALRLMTEIARRFGHGETALGVNAYAEQLAVPSGLVGRIVDDLQAAKLLVPVNCQDGAFVPARPIEQISAHEILQALRSGRGLELETSDDPARIAVRNRFEAISEAERGAARTINLQDLARCVDEGKESGRDSLPASPPHRS